MSQSLCKTFPKAEGNPAAHGSRKGCREALGRFQSCISSFDTLRLYKDWSGVLDFSDRKIAGDDQICNNNSSFGQYFLSQTSKSLGKKPQDTMPTSSSAPVLGHILCSFQSANMSMFHHRTQITTPSENKPSDYVSCHDSVSSPELGPPAEDAVNTMCFACMYVWVPFECLVLEEAKRRNRIPWNWSYRAPMWTEGIEPGPLEKQIILLLAEPSLQAYKNDA
ncbi:hypothetical protein STEG23_016024, partial [Scotinomys teguina]